MVWLGCVASIASLRSEAGGAVGKKDGGIDVSERVLRGFEEPLGPRLRNWNGTWRGVVRELGCGRREGGRGEHTHSLAGWKATGLASLVCTVEVMIIKNIDD